MYPESFIVSTSTSFTPELPPAGPPHVNALHLPTLSLPSEQHPRSQRGSYNADMTTPASASPLGVLTSPKQHRAPSRTNLQPNVANVVLGNLHIKPWYPSFYPEDMVGGKKVDWLYVCAWCFRYTGEIMRFCAHTVRLPPCESHASRFQKVCPLRTDPPPGDVIYQGPEYVIHELDGASHTLYAQNLSLLAKLFLDTKSVFFDVGTFLYYTLVQRPTSAHPYGQVVGFFSKEKMSWDNNNLACILVFPPWQRKGLGQVLIATSYELGRREGRFGGPERPLSAPGRKGYLAFWCGEVCRYLLACSSKRTITVEDISEALYVIKEDVVMALKEMDCYETRKTGAGSVVVNKSKVKEWAIEHGVSEKPVINVAAFVEDQEREDDESVGD
nr:histone acetyltransferase tip60 like [Quercus suber]